MDAVLDDDSSRWPNSLTPSEVAYCLRLKCLQAGAVFSNPILEDNGTLVPSTCSKTFRLWGFKGATRHLRTIRAINGAVMLARWNAEARVR
jgi:hypothetical protein